MKEVERRKVALVQKARVDLDALFWQVDQSKYTVDISYLDI